MHPPLKIISQEELLKTELFSFYKTKIKISKRNYLHYNLYRQPTVGVFPIDKDGFVYLIKQYRYIYKKYLIEEASGHINKNEIALSGAKRELMEETGISAGRWKKFLSINSSASVVKSNHTLYIAEDLSFNKPKPEEDENIELLKLKIDSALELILKKKITTASTIAGLLFIKNYYTPATS